MGICNGEGEDVGDVSFVALASAVCGGAGCFTIIDRMRCEVLFRLVIVSLGIL